MEIQEWITIKCRCAKWQTHFEEQVVSVSLTFDVQPTLFLPITQCQLSTVIYPGGKQLTVQLMEVVCLIAVKIWLKYWQVMLNFKISWKDFFLSGVLIWLHHHTMSREQRSQVTAASSLSNVWPSEIIHCWLLGYPTHFSIPLAFKEE